jgi:hypothetical protein
MGASTGINAMHIFTMAKSEYRDMLLDNKWTGILNTGDDAGSEIHLSKTDLASP